MQLIMEKIEDMVLFLVTSLVIGRDEANFALISVSISHF